MGDVVGQVLVSGILIGLVYGVIAICIGIIYNATQIVNFAQGEFVMVGGVVAWALIAEAHLPVWAAVAIAVLAGTLVAVAIERAVINTARRFRPPPFTYVFLTFGISLVLSNVSMFAFGTNPLTFDPFLGRAPLTIGSVSIASQYLLVLPLCLLLLGGLAWFFSYTRFGKAMRAAAVNERGAVIVGIDVGRLSMTAFGISGALSALVGAFLTPITTTYYAIGLSFTLKAFAAAIAGGLGNFRGALLGGILVGLVESLAAGIISSQMKDAITFGFIIVVLLLLPKGILPSLVEERERV